MLLDEFTGLLEKLSNAVSPTGFEKEVRDIIIKEVKGYSDEIKVDRLGNVIVHKKGKGKKVLVDAHMDEVGFIITKINDDGTLNFSSLGGINSKIIPCKTLYVGENNICGVTGIKPIHLQTREERNKSVTYGDCVIDIGANSKEEAKKYVSLGDYAVFDTKLHKLSENFVKGKAFDDRMGCAVLIEALKESYDCDFYGVFAVQEEVGERGAYTASFGIDPDIAIALEGTVCADMPNIKKDLCATELGKGPALSIMDNAGMFDPELLRSIVSFAEKKNINYQLRKASGGGNDAGAIYKTGLSAKTAAISVPCRYIHSSVSVASLEDCENTVKLLTGYVKTI